MNDELSSSYRSDAIKPIRPPDIRRVDGAWLATWQITLAADVSIAEVAQLQDAIASAIGIEIAARFKAINAVEIETRSSSSPLDVESWPWVNEMLQMVDQCARLISINGTPRDWWRPFRDSGAKEGGSAQ